MAGRAFDAIAQTGGRFADFGPYVPSINDGGAVAFQATTADGGSSVFIGGGETPSPVNRGPATEVTSHPDIDSGGATCFYGSLEGGGQGVVVVADGVARVVARTGRTLSGIGPLGPTMNRHGAVAYRATSRDGVHGVYVAGRDGVSEIATARDTYRSFDGLPVLNDAGAVAFRAETSAGSVGIYLADAGRVEPIARTGDLFAELGRFPIVDDTGTVAFCARMADDEQAVFLARGGELERVVDTSASFESFRGVLIDAGRLSVFYATPRGGHMGIYTGPDPVADRVLGIGDAAFGSTIAAFVLNPVSVNAAQQIAVRLELNDGRGVIARLDVS